MGRVMPKVKIDIDWIAFAKSMMCLLLISYLLAVWVISSR